MRQSRLTNLLNSHFQDRKTKDLYDKLKEIANPLTASQFKELNEVQKNTVVNSHYHPQFNQSIRQNLLQKCQIPENITLRVCNQVQRLPKNKSFRIIKVTRSEGKPITEEELKRRLANKNNRQILYQYASTEHHNALKQQQKGDLAVSIYQPDHQFSMLHEEKQDNKETRRYDFSLFRKQSGIILTREPKYNFFSILDPIFNKESQGLQINQICAPAIKANLWK